MNDFGEKILKIVLGEIIGAFVFIVGLMVIGALPNDEISSQLTNLVLICWGLYGVGTPLVVFLELEKEIFILFGGLKR